MWTNKGEEDNSLLTFRFSDGHALVLMLQYNNNNNNNNDNIYGAVIVAKATARAPGSCDEYGTAPSGRRPSDQAK